MKKTCLFAALMVVCRLEPANAATLRLLGTPAPDPSLGVQGDWDLGVYGYSAVVSAQYVHDFRNYNSASNFAEMGSLWMSGEDGSWISPLVAFNGSYIEGVSNPHLSVACSVGAAIKVSNGLGWVAVRPKLTYLPDGGSFNFLASLISEPAPLEVGIDVTPRLALGLKLSPVPFEIVYRL